MAPPSIWHLSYGTYEPFDRKVTPGLDNRLEGARVEGEHVGRSGICGVRDAEPCLWGGWGKPRGPALEHRQLTVSDPLFWNELEDKGRERFCIHTFH